jgi:hypothetical protein
MPVTRLFGVCTGLSLGGGCIHETVKRGSVFRSDHRRDCICQYGFADSARNALFRRYWLQQPLYIRSAGDSTGGRGRNIQPGGCPGPRCLGYYCWFPETSRFLNTRTVLVATSRPGATSLSSPMRPQLEALLSLMPRALAVLPAGFALSANTVGLLETQTEVGSRFHNLHGFVRTCKGHLPDTRRLCGRAMRNSGASQNHPQWRFWG